MKREFSFLSHRYSQKTDRDVGTFADWQRPELEVPEGGHVQTFGLKETGPEGRGTLGVG